jgi:hypothetical protein
MSVLLQPADIFFTKGKDFLSRAIRVCTRAFGESRTKVNHTGLIVSSGDLQTAQAVEALITVKKHPLWSHYGPPDKNEVAIFRATDLSHADIEKIVAGAESYVGRKYGVFKLLAHFLDWLLQGAYVFRRLAQMDDYPICSWVVAYAFEKAGVSFGVPPNAASPDDIWDYIHAHPEDYVEIYPLSPLGA